MLEYIERHKVGILTTIVIHLFLVTIFMALQFSSVTEKKEKQQIVVDFVDQEQLEKEIEQKKAEIKKVASAELMHEIKNETRNIAINETERAAEKNIEKMVNDIKGELNVKDRPAFDPNQISTQKKEAEKKEAAPQPQKKEFTVNERGERSFFKGNTTISYKLEGRMHVYLPVPVYKCQGSGVVIMDIDVDQNGFVVSATIRKKDSKINDSCLEEAATRAALTSRFDVNGTIAKQRGYISYTFIAQ